MSIRGSARTSLTLAALAVLAEPRAAAAQEAATFAGRTISIVVGYSAGGGYDLYARALARHMGRNTAGAPSVIVQNMPGAASLLAVRHLDANPAKDGTVIAMFDPGLILTSLSAPPGPNKVNLAEYRWIGTLLRDIRICYSWGATGVRSWADLMARKEFLLGSTAKGSNAYVNGAIVKNVLSAPVRFVTGYPGSNEQRIALERGELEGNCASWSAMPQDWITGNKVSTLLRFSPVRPPDMAADVPYVLDLARSQEQKDLLLILNAPTELGRPFVVAREVPKERVEALRKAFEATLRDAEFVAEMARQKMPVDPVTGTEAESIVQRIYAATPAVVAKVKEVLD